jgi:hypothetical protein
MDAVANEESQRVGNDVHTKKDEELDAGTVTGVGTSDPLTVSVRDQIKREQAKTTSYLAYALIATLLLSVIGHYVATLALHLSGKSEVATALSDIYEKWLPVITGFTGSAVTYFLTRER